MPFYLPKSQVKTNLYTNGNEYMVASTSNPYTGYYYETSKGEKFIGKIPNYPNFRHRRYIVKFFTKNRSN